MKTYLSQNCWKKLDVILLLALILTGAVKAGEQSTCDTCATQRTIQILQSNETSDSAESATSINNDKTRLSNKELTEEYRASIEGSVNSVL